MYVSPYSFILNCFKLIALYYHIMYDTIKSGLHPAWVVGFIDGEGNFSVGIYPNATHRLGYQVQLRMSISQHIRDVELMLRFQTFFKCGNVVNDTSTKKQFRIQGFQDLENRLFPLLDEFPLQTQKALDVKAFREVHEMMKQNAHLTLEGIKEIRAIKATLNRGRMMNQKTSVGY